MAFEMSDNHRKAIEAKIRSQHPEYNDKAVKHELLRRMIGDELFQQMMKDIGNRL